VHYIQNLGLDEMPRGFGTNYSRNELDSYYAQSDLNLIDQDIKKLNVRG